MQQEVQGGGCAGDLGGGEHVAQGGGEVEGGSLRFGKSHKIAIETEEKNPEDCCLIKFKEYTSLF